MSITLTDFKNNLQDILRPNRFLLLFNTPSGVSTDTTRLSYLVKAASLPAMKVTPINVPWQGIETKIAGDFEFDDWKVTFYDDYAYQARSFIENWLQSIANPLTNIRSVQAAYQTNITAQQLGRDGEVVGEYNLIGQPNEVAAITLSQEDMSKTIEFEATFSIDYWTRVTP